MSTTHSVTASQQKKMMNGYSALESTLNRLSKWIFLALFCAVVLLRHDAEALWASVGAWLSKTLKRLLNQDRPASAQKSEPGTPSSHSQIIFFIVIFFILSTMEWLGMNGFTLTLNGLVFAFGSIISWLRVSQQLHTMGQVIVGATFGSIFFVSWLGSWHAIMMKLVFTYVLVQVIVILGAAGYCIMHSYM